MHERQQRVGEGRLPRQPEPSTLFKGVEVAVAAQMRYYDEWGSDKTYPHMAVGWTGAMSTPYKWTRQVPMGCSQPKASKA